MSSKLLVPDFPTPVSIFTAANAIQLAQNPRVNTTGQLLVIFESNYGWAQGAYVTRAPMLLLLPFGVDIRGMESTGPLDYAQIPAGTGNWFIVAEVKDRWLGYTGHHLLCTVWPRGQLIPHNTAVLNPCTVPAIPTAYRTPFVP
jgi:hypothetical protein